MWVVQPLWQQGSSLKIWQHHSLCGVLLMWYTQVKTDYLYLTARWVLCWEVKCVAFVNTRGMPAIEHSLVVIRPQSGNQTKNFSTRACVVQFVTTTQKRFSHRWRHQLFWRRQRMVWTIFWHSAIGCQVKFWHRRQKCRSDRWSWSRRHPMWKPLKSPVLGTSHRIKFHCCHQHLRDAPALLSLQKHSRCNIKCLLQRLSGLVTTAWSARLIWFFIALQDENSIEVRTTSTAREDSLFCDCLKGEPKRETMGKVCTLFWGKFWNWRQWNSLNLRESMICFG